jgi:hypothetical protein
MRPAGALLLAAAVALLVQPCQSAASIAEYPIDWTSVPTAANPNVSIQADCICKLQSTACTPNCCCDPDCPPPVAAAWNASYACLPEGPPPDQLAYCKPADPFAQVGAGAGGRQRPCRRARAAATTFAGVRGQPPAAGAGIDRACPTPYAACRKHATLQVNLPPGDYYRIQNVQASQDFMNQLLCITLDNNPSLGEGYPGARWAGGPAAGAPWLARQR